MNKAILLGLFLVFSAHAHAEKTVGNGGNTGSNTVNDTSTSIKSNIVLFRILTSGGSSTGSLRTAGKVARTSSSHPLGKNAGTPGEG